MKNSSAALGDDVLFSSTNVFCTMKLQPIIYLLRLPKSGASHSLFLIRDPMGLFSIPGELTLLLFLSNRYFPMNGIYNLLLYYAGLFKVTGN